MVAIEIFIKLEYMLFVVCRKCTGVMWFSPFVIAIE